MYTFAPLLVKLCWKSPYSYANSVHLCRAPRVIDLCKNECEVWVPKGVYLECGSLYTCLWIFHFLLTSVYQ